MWSKRLIALLLCLTLLCGTAVFAAEGEEQSCTDTEAFDGRAFYEAMRAGRSVVTSQITPQRYVDAFRPLHF